MFRKRYYYRGAIYAKNYNGENEARVKVAYEIPDVVPYLDEDGNKKYMPSRDYIKKELEKELTVREDISAALSDHSMANDTDIAKLEYTMRDPDEISYCGKTQAYWTVKNGKSKTADTVLYEKVIGEKSYYVVQATPDTKAKTLFVVTAFIGKSGYKNKKEAPQLANTQSPGVTSEIDSVVTSNNNIPQTYQKKQYPF